MLIIANYFSKFLGFDFLSGIRNLFTTQPVLLKKDTNIPPTKEINNIINDSNTNLNNLNNWYNFSDNWKFQA